MAREKSRNKLRHRKAESEQWRQSRNTHTPTPPPPNPHPPEIQRHTKIESGWEENRPERREIETGKQRYTHGDGGRR